MRCHSCDRESPNEAEHLSHKCLHEDVERVRRIINNHVGQRVYKAPTHTPDYYAVVDAHSRLGNELCQLLTDIDIVLDWRARVRALFGRTIRITLRQACDNWGVRILAANASVAVDPIRRRDHPGVVQASAEQVEQSGPSVSDV